MLAASANACHTPTLALFRRAGRILLRSATRSRGPRATKIPPGPTGSAAVKYFATVTNAADLPFHLTVAG
jgi:hypothetical protein